MKKLLDALFGDMPGSLHSVSAVLDRIPKLLFQVEVKPWAVGVESDEGSGSHRFHFGFVAVTPMRLSPRMYGVAPLDAEEPIRFIVGQF